MGAETGHSARELEAQAAAWLAKFDRRSPVAEDRNAFDAWLGSGFAHRIAYLRLEAVWERASRLRELGGPMPGERV